MQLSCGGLRGRLYGELCRLMRGLGFPVVGDRDAKHERGALPRSCAGLKNKLWVGCYAIIAALAPPLHPIRVEATVPNRLLAS